jgi:hypothetical protein
VMSFYMTTPALRCVRFTMQQSHKSNIVELKRAYSSQSQSNFSLPAARRKNISDTINRINGNENDSFSTLSKEHSISSNRLHKFNNIYFDNLFKRKVDVI